MEQSPNLSLSYVLPQQAQKHVTVNESLRRLDALVQASVISRAISEEPATPIEGDAYLLETTPTGLHWQNFSEGNFAVFQDTAWSEIIPQAGWRVYVDDEDSLLVLGANGWGPLGASQSDDQLAQLGINTSADETNRLAVKADAVLFSYDDVTPGSGDLRHVFNKSDPSKSGSLLFQTAFSGRIELGLLGNDDFTIQVSDDGQTFLNALKIDHQTGHTQIHELTVAPENGNARVNFSTSQNAAFWSLNQEADNSLSIQRLTGGFGTGGRVFTYDENGLLGLWGAPSSKGRIAVRSNINAEGVDNILYLEQTALSAANGVVQFHNNQDTATPILRCTTNSRTVLSVPASGSISAGAPIQLLRATLASLPSASTSGDGAMIYVSDAADGAVPAFSDGTNWRRVTDRAIVS